jgi:hypothetical protein
VPQDRFSSDSSGTSTHAFLKIIKKKCLPKQLTFIRPFKINRFSSPRWGNLYFILFFFYFPSHPRWNEDQNLIYGTKKRKKTRNWPSDSGPVLCMRKHVNARRREKILLSDHLVTIAVDGTQLSTIHCMHKVEKNINKYWDGAKKLGPTVMKTYWF